jgi:Domain of unknown function (DUF3427)
VLFQQQIGRGLRLHEAKQSCLVLDFVGRYRTDFRFDRLLSALTGLSRGQMIEASDDRKVELLFVTLDKSEGFHDAIAYHDYAISADRFHWQSQNSAGPETTAGQRYLNSPGNGRSFQIFIRRNQGEPYRACGPVVLEKASGEKPMSIEWRMGVPLPVRLFQEFSVLRGQ